MNCVFSPCRNYRYTLTRMVPATLSLEPRKFYGTTVQFIGLNPSTADETKDDPTIRRLIGFASSWGFTRMVMTNLFAYRVTDPEAMKKQDDPIGPENDGCLIETSNKAHLVVACWGNHGAHLGRSKAVRDMIPMLQCFRITGKGEPEHPLYLPKDMEPTPYKP